MSAIFLQIVAISDARSCLFLVPVMNLLPSSSRHRNNLLTAFALAAILSMPAACGYLRSDAEKCSETRGDPDLRITYCTRAIDSGNLSNQVLAASFGNRGTAWHIKKNYDRAIADYDAAIRLNPASAIFIRARGSAWFEQKNYERAVVDYDAAIALDPSNFYTIHARVITLVQLKRFPAAANDLMTLIKGNPSEVQKMSPGLIAGLVSNLSTDNRGDAALELLNALEKADYRGPGALVPMEGLHGLMILELLRHKQTDEAIRYVATLTAYRELLQLRTDRRFEPLWSDPGAQPFLQPKDFPGRDLAAARKLTAQNPRNLTARGRLVRSLTLNGRYAEAINVGQRALDNPSDYDRDSRSAAALRNYVADAFLSNGQPDEANTALQPLLELRVEDHYFLAGQFINYGQMLLIEGHFPEALDVAKKARGTANAYGEKWIQSITTCGLSLLAQDAEANASLVDLLKTPEDNYVAVAHALMCLKREDDAASMIAKGLHAETSRSAMLVALQACLENPKRPALEHMQRAMWSRLARRPDVRKALEPVGVIIEEPVACGD